MDVNDKGAWGQSPEQEFGAEVPESLEHVRATGARRQDRRRAILSGSAAALILLVGLTAVLVSDDSSPKTNVATEGRTPVTVTTTPTSTTTESPKATVPAAQPETMVVITTEGSLEVRETATNKTIRVLTNVVTNYREVFESGDEYKSETEHLAGSNDLYLSPDGQTVYFQNIVGCGNPMLQKISINGGKIEDVAGPFSSGQLSPDGTKLAFIEAECDSGGAAYSVDLNSGKKTLLAKVNNFDADDNQKEVTRGLELAWFGDNQHIALSVSSGRSVSGEYKVESVEIRKLPTDKLSGVQGGTLISKGKKSYKGYASLPDGTAFALETDADSAASKLVVFDPSTGKATKTIATGAADRYYSSLTVDNSGQHFAYVSAAPAKVDKDGNVETYTYSLRTRGPNDPKTLVKATDIGGIAWR